MTIDPSSVLTADRIIEIKGRKKSEVLDEMLAVLATSPHVTDPAELRTKLLERERTVSTGIGEGMAIPHVKIPSIKDFVAAVGVSRDGVDFESLDKKPTHIIVMIGCNNGQSGDFLKVLARIVTRLKDKTIQRRILEATTSEEVCHIFVDSEGVLA